MTTTETAGADARAAAVMTDTDHAAHLMIAIAGGRRVHESEFCVFRLLVLTCFLQRLDFIFFSFLSSGLVDGCTREEEAAAARTTGTPCF